MAKIVKKILPMLAVIMTAAFPAVFLYCNNSEEAPFSEILPTLVACVLVGLVLFLIWWLLTKNTYKAAVITVMFLLVMLNFAQLESAVRLVLPYAKYWHIMPTAFFLLLFFGYLILEFIPEEIAKTISNVACLVVCVLILLNVFISIPGSVNRIRSEQKMKNKAEAVDVNIGGTEKQPNIYWFLFDEYANFNQMEKYYNYDNATLKNYLEKNNFNISYSSRNESIITATITTNIVNLDYIVHNDTSSSEKDLLRKQGVMFALLQEKGYSLRGLDTSNFFGLPVAGETLNQIEKAVTVGGQDIGDLCIAQTIIYPLHNIDTSVAISDIMEIVNFMSIPENLKESNTFTLTYLSFPHTPFLVDENGQPLRSEFYNNWEDDRYYLGQYKYATKLMIQMIDNILENDPDSIIILQSDHGARAHGMEFFMTKFPLEVMQNPLNAVYYRGQKLDIEGLSSVNTMRAIFNELFSMNYEMLPVPEDTYKYK